MSPHDVIVQLVGNTFGTGDQLAREILGALKESGYIVIKGADLESALKKRLRSAFEEVWNG